MPDSTEIELKLALVRGTATAAKRALRAAALQRTAIDDVYFDTPDAGLRRRGLVLRIRRDGERWLQTLKASGASSGIVPVRGEWEVRLEDGPSMPALDLEKLDIAPLRELLSTGFETTGLAPVFRTRITRRRGNIVHGTSAIEVALDRGELRALVDGHGKRQPVSEVELELKSGRAEDLLGLASALVLRRQVTLVPALRSKAERGYALASSSRLPVVHASARGFAQHMTTADALRAVVHHGLGIAVANADALRSAPASEHVHQARVALRRMRSAVRLFDPRGTDMPAMLVTELRWLARRLGRARDWDVLADTTLPAILESAGLGDKPARTLSRAARRTRNGALARAVDAVSSRRYSNLVLHLAQWSLSDPPATTPSVGAAAAGLLEPAADRLFSLARPFDQLGARRRHRVRIHAKRLRYALDLLHEMLPSRSGQAYIDALASLQDTLGEMNDATVAHVLLPSLHPGRQSMKALDKWYRRTEPGVVARAARQLRALRRRPRPWHAA
jgi:triphosphatase